MTGTGQDQDSAERRPRTLVVCCDGTWNDPTANTNIWRTHKLLCDAAGLVPGDPKSGEPIAVEGEIGGEPVALFYDTGVGTERDNRFRGGTFARGLANNVLEAYDFLAWRWQPGDRIFCFGFSRGAFTARSLCGMIGAVGMLRTAGLEPNEAQRRMDLAFQYYRTPPRRRPSSPRKAELGAFPKAVAPIRFLGVYDTVGSLGVVAPAFAFLNDLLFSQRIGFHDVRLGSRIENACQALAIHERRGAYKPVVWSEAPGFVPAEGGPPGPQRVLQVWFSGAHSDVGAGYEEDDLSCIPLRWMLGQAVAVGLPLPSLDQVCRGMGNPIGPRHDSSEGFLARLMDGSYADAVGGAAQGLPPTVGWIARGLAVLLGLFRVPPLERQIGYEHRHDDGTFSVAYGERIHESVLRRYPPHARPATIRQALELGVEVAFDGLEPEHETWDLHQIELGGRTCCLFSLTPERMRVGCAYHLVEGEVYDVNVAGLQPRALVEWVRGGEAQLRFLWRSGRPAGDAAAAEPPPQPRLAAE